MKKIRHLPICAGGRYRSFPPICGNCLLSGLQRPIAFELGMHIMKWIFIFALFFFEIARQAQLPPKKFVRVIHGGAGWGEYFIHLVIAKTISDMMEFGKRKLKQMLMKWS
jgi:hypothetical protein